ncbi:tRNA lysidine(34) synthetase TilS [Buchnera aphidicola (Mollitrichosiphum nigrofasciatum)]|uniref:tRNA lysidine(34) synthetase TilS n=1 Tax=Buchnera aphidicola TaxID=9 RepID=UPI0031B88286
MNNILLKIKKNTNIKKKILAYSGGLDSTFLLYTLIKNKIRAIHIDHHQNEKSYIWTQHCKKICKKLNIYLIIKNIYIQNIQKKGFESQARNLRYKKIKKHIQRKEILLTGHHKNDQVETLILSLKRGSGPLGLSGMREFKKFQKIKILRPLIYTSKKKIYKWAIKNNVPYINDYSNKNITYDRNFIRFKILPILQKRWNYFIKNSLKTMHLCKEQNLLIKYFIKKSIKNISYKKNKINLFKIKYINKILRNNILKYWIKKNTKHLISKNNINQINKNLIFLKKKNTKIKIKNFIIEKFKNTLLIKKFQKKTNNLILYWSQIKKPLILPHKLGFLIFDNKKKKNIPKPKKNEQINIKFNTKGKLLTLHNKYITLKKIWKKYKISKNKRINTPLLFYNNKFVSVIGIYDHSIKYFKKKKSLSWIK